MVAIKTIGCVSYRMGLAANDHHSRPAADSSTYSTIKSIDIGRCVRTDHIYRFSGQITPGQSSRNVTAIAKSLFTQMSQSLNSVNPTVFWMVSKSFQNMRSD